MSHKCGPSCHRKQGTRSECATCRGSGRRKEGQLRVVRYEEPLDEGTRPAAWAEVINKYKVRSRSGA